MAWLAGRFGDVPGSVQRELLTQIQPGQPAAVRMAAVNRIAAIAKAGDSSLIGVFPPDVQAFVNTALQAVYDDPVERIAYADDKVDITSTPLVVERVEDTKLQAAPIEPPVTIDERMESLGFDPSLDRGAVLPFAINSQGETEFALQSFLYEPAKAALMPGHLYQGGVATNEELLAASMDLTGVGMVGGLTMAPRGSLSSSGALPVDKASRLLRAEQMGFHTDIPLFHGTAADIKAFDPSLAGSTTGEAGLQAGVSTALDPKTAGQFADLAAGLRQGNGQNIVQLLHRAENPGRIVLTGDELAHEVRATVLEAFDNGFDAVLITNYTAPGGETGRSILIVKDPSQLRSPNARFDPSRVYDPDLLAGTAVLTGVGAFRDDEDQP